jgi:DeoR family glycerol-3-phosphate regulon repressor
MAVSELAQRFSVSEETIRRDARQLELRGEIIKNHGSLRLPPHHLEASFESRMREHAEAKLAIARKAIEIVHDGDSLIIDTGTTTTFFARELRQRKNLTVITNSTEIARLLLPVTGNRVFLAGGEVSAYDGAAYGPTTTEFVSRFNPKFAFLSIGAIDDVHGPTDASLPEAEFGRIALRAANFGVILADANKFGRIALVKVCSLSEVDMIITDRLPDSKLAEKFRENEVELRLSGAL